MDMLRQSRAMELDSSRPNTRDGSYQLAVNIPMPTPEAPKPNFIELAVEGIKRVGSGTFDGAMAIGAATVNGVKFVGGGVGAGFLAVFGEGIDKTDTGLEAAFAKVDTDKNGKIDAAEMKAYILSVYDKELDLKIIDEMMTADTNKDGEIDLAEFKVIMRAGPPVGAIDNFLNMCMHPPREIEEWAIPPPRSPPALTSVLTPRAVSPSTRHALSPPRQTQLGTQRPTL